jgi:DNA-directed RNA polymerase subunit RPC12/RpoP
MIYFCEDCGEKNILTSTQLEDDKAVFRCTECSYMNSYSTKPPEKSCVTKANKFAEEIRQSPQIIGSFLFEKKSGVLKNNMPDSLEQKEINRLGKILTQNYLDCHSHYGDILDMTLAMEGKNMVVKKIDPGMTPGIFIVLVCKTLPLSREISDKLTLLAVNNKIENG